MVRFAEGELALPIRSILWAPSNAAHYNHLHVEGFPYVNGTLDNCTSKWTEAITTIRGALDGHFGLGDHWQVWDDTLAWTHMGVYNCRNIANTNTPSQHAFSNAIDIGPYYGVAQQQKFYDFLTRKKGEEEMPLSQQDLDNIAAVVLGAQFGGPQGSPNRKSLALHILGIKSAIAGLDVDLSAADIAAIVDAIEGAGIASAVADEIDARNRARLGPQ